MANQRSGAVAATPNEPAKTEASYTDRLIEYTPFMAEEPIKLSAGMVLKFLCRPTKSGKVCTTDQAVRFVMLCMARKLNPWEGDAFLVGYDGKDGPEFSLITAHQAFLKRAEAHEAFDGMESGVLVVRGSGPAVELHGDYHAQDETLVGAWAKVYRKDRSHPTYRRLKLATFNKGFSRWNVDPAGMIVKCAEADALRSTFPNNLAGMFAEEMGPDTGAPTIQRRKGLDFRGDASANGSTQAVETGGEAEVKCDGTHPMPVCAAGDQCWHMETCPPNGMFDGEDARANMR